MAPIGPKLLAEEALYSFAIRSLARRSLTAHELRTRLEKRAAQSGAIENILKRLAQEHYLDDKRLADAYVLICKEHDGLGQRRVLADLQRRGIAKHVAEEAVNQVYGDTDEHQLIIRQLRQKFGEDFTTRPIEDPKKLLALYRSLIRAGFSSDKIGNALRIIAPSTDWPVDFPEYPLDSDQEVFD